jgi:alkylated DNA nucleotide flippase Atl1
LKEVLEALPVGNWTSYGDLAEFGGTGAQAVGDFVANRSQAPNAFKVLSADGSVNPLFHWHDPSDSRNVQEVLASEGIGFDDGRADPVKRMSSEDLASLVENNDEDEIPLEEL